MTTPDKIIASFHGNMVIGEKTYPYGPWFAVDNPLRSSGVEYVRLEPNTRVVTVDQLKLWSTIMEATNSCLKTWNGFGSFMNVDSAMLEIRAIIGEVQE
jgi:hypothetical protein